MKKAFRSILLMLVFLLLIVDANSAEVCFESYGVPVTPEYIAEWAFVTFNWVEGRPGMRAEASYIYDEETNSVICVVTARMPDRVLGDPDMDAIGHEIMHCITGDFHKGQH